MDFAENFSFIVQDEAQSYHWTNNQALIFTAVAYFKQQGNEVKHRSYALVSGSTIKHDSVSVCICQKKIIEDLRKEVPVTEVFYVTDGAAQHFKNKFQFVQLMHHLADLGIRVECRMALSRHRSRQRAVRWYWGKP